MRIAFVTSVAFPGIHLDDLPAAQSLRDMGAHVESAAWTDPSVAWETFDICIVRSTWDFHLHLPRFLDWAGRVAGTSLLLNSPRLIRWNSHKSYLLELESKGVDIVPTILAKREDLASIPSLLEHRSRPRFVVKPAVSASSYRTQVFDAYTRDTEDLLRTIADETDVLVQPFVDDVLIGGERSYIVIDGTITHAVRRAPFNGGARGEDQPLVACRIADVKLVFEVLEALPDRPVYARIDIVHLQPGRPAVAEVELIEPNLFFSKFPSAGRRMAGSVLREYERGSRGQTACQPP